MVDTTQREVTCEKHSITYSANVMMFGGKEIVTDCPECQNEYEKRQREKEQLARQEHNQKMIAHEFKRSGIPPRYTTRSFDNFRAANDEQKKAWRMAKGYADTITEKMQSGAGLILAGKPGTGKTHLACAVANQFVTTGCNVLFITVSAMLRRIRETYRKDSNKTEQQAIDELRNIDLLIIDEIGVQKGSESEEHLLFEVINERYNYFKPTILISNLNAKDIKQFIGERALDRMREGGGKFIAFEWESYRSNVAADENLPDASKAIYTVDNKQQYI